MRPIDTGGRRRRPAETRPGLYIAVDGPSGSGKSELCKALAARFVEAGLSTTLTWTPSTSEQGQDALRMVREDPGRTPRRREVIADAMELDRAIHHERVVAPALKRQQVVLQDRSYLSCFAYQGVGLAPRELADFLGRLEADPDVLPDLIVILHTPLDTCLQRIARRSRPTGAQEAPSFQAEVHDMYARFPASGAHVLRLGAAGQDPVTLADVVYRAATRKAPNLAHAQRMHALSLVAFTAALIIIAGSVLRLVLGV